MNNLRMLPKPTRRLINQRLNRRNMLTIIHNPTQNHANRASPLRLNHMLTDQTLRDPLKILIGDNLHEARSDRQKLARKPLRTVTISDPTAQGLRNTKIRQTLLKNLIIEEIVTHKSAQTIANLILLARNQTRMRNRQTHRTAEQRRDRKPIRQRANHAALGARPRSGVEVLLELVGFDEAVVDAQLVVTGEGALDEQTLRGKAPAGVAARAAAAGVATVAVAGRCELAEQRLREGGFAAAYALSEIEPDPERSVREAGALLVPLGERIAREWL